MTKSLTKEQYAKIGEECRKAVDGNLLVGSFAAEMVGEGYPFTKAMCDVVFKGLTDEDIGRKFDAWMQRGKQ